MSHFTYTEEPYILVRYDSLLIAIDWLKNINSKSFQKNNKKRNQKGVLYSNFIYPIKPLTIFKNSKNFHDFLIFLMRILDRKPDINFIETNLKKINFSSF